MTTLERIVDDDSVGRADINSDDLERDLRHEIIVNIAFIGSVFIY